MCEVGVCDDVGQVVFVVDYWQCFYVVVIEQCECGFD